METSIIGCYHRRWQDDRNPY